MILPDRSDHDHCVEISLEFFGQSITLRGDVPAEVGQRAAESLAARATEIAGRLHGASPAKISLLVALETAVDRETVAAQKTHAEAALEEARTRLAAVESTVEEARTEAAAASAERDAARAHLEDVLAEAARREQDAWFRVAALEQALKRAGGRLPRKLRRAA